MRVAESLFFFIFRTSKQSGAWKMCVFVIVAKAISKVIMKECKNSKGMCVCVCIYVCVCVCVCKRESERESS